MMDYEKLIDGLKNSKGPDNCHDCALGYWALMGATALSALQAENERLRGKAEYEEAHANAYYLDCLEWEIENDGLRNELEQVKREREELKAALRREQDEKGGDSE